MEVLYYIFIYFLLFIYWFSFIFCFKRRLLKELNELANDPPAFIRIDQESVYKNLTECVILIYNLLTVFLHLKLFWLFIFVRWTVELDGAPGSIYSNEHFRLKFIFSSKYPFDSPQGMPR